MKDELPNTVQHGGYIIHMQSSNKGTSTQRVSLFIIRDNASWFDTFGVVPPVKICEFVKKKNGLIYIIIIRLFKIYNHVN